MKNKKGFTLIELLVVVLIIGILAAIALPQYFRAVEKSKATEALSILGSLAASAERHRLVSDVWPTDVADLDLEFVNKDGTAASGASFTTQSFTITIGDGVVTAERTAGDDNGYIITRQITSGKVTCTGGAKGTTCKALALDAS